jgi:LmbE family N-acetylglucosaminyl deacetylase
LPLDDGRNGEAEPTVVMLRLRAHIDEDRPLQLLCLGAHSDDLEIGCAGTVMVWLTSFRPVEVVWVVLSASGVRRQEARNSAEELLRDAHRHEIVCGDFRDGYFPSEYAAIKEFFERLKGRHRPDVILTHRLEDRHQDHRLTAELTWNTWRNHLILEYEIPKYEGDLDRPNAFVEVPEELAAKKAAHLDRHFGSQRSKDWFRSDLFLSVMRLRGVEGRAGSGYAEAFHMRKVKL